MDPFSSGDDTAIKSRKPYTISKQRERWTEEEHNRFLEAIKLYGRAWQRIEEHIGRKTAVQIRSHAQKFFLKLEKDASGKGMLSSEVNDIDIPPPRPKKKPSYPYPRKISAPSTAGPVEGKDGKLCTTVPSCPIQQLPEFQNKGLQEKPIGNEKQETTCTAASLAPACTSMTCEKPTNLTLGNIPCTYEESASLVRKVNHENELPDEPNQHPERAGAGLATMTGEKGDLKSSQPTPDEAAEYVKKRDNFQNCYPLVSAEASQSEPCKIPAQTLDGILEPARLNAYPIYHNHLPNQPGRATVSLHDFLSSNTSATLEPQNPAALAAASVTAATFWPNMGAPAGYCPEFLPKVISSSEASPAIAAMAAATVAAAAAWWASNGLISLYAPQQSVTVNQSCCTTNNAVPPYAEARTWNVTNEQTQMDPTAPLGQQVEVVDSRIFPGRNSAFKPLIRVAGKPEENQNLLKSRQVLPTAVISNKKSTAMGAQIQGSNSHIEDRKKVDRSSSGSNTTSSTESYVLEKQERGNEESNGSVGVQSVGNSSSRRSRNTANTNESWKEVSREGRVAFRALFSWQVLPQKFPSSQDPSTLEKQGTIDQDSEVKLGALVSPIDLNSTILESCCSEQVSDDKAVVECKGKEMLNCIGLGKLGNHKTGFKPYKRSCVEAKDTNASTSCSQGKEKRPKRIREASA